MKPLKQWNKTRVGLVAAAIIGGLVLLTFSLTALNLGDTTYTAEFERTGGAKAGDEVRIAGVGIGKVADVRLEGDRVVVEMAVAGDVELGSRTKAAVKLATLLGNSYIELTPQGKGELPDNRIPLRSTVVSFAIQDVLERGGPALEELDTNKLRQSLQVMADAFRETPESVRSALNGLSRISKVFAERKDQFADLLTGANDVIETLESNSGSIVKLMAQSDLLLQEITNRRQAIHDLLSRSRKLAAQLSGLVTDNEAEVGPMLKRLNTVTAILKKRSASLDRGIKALAPVARYANNAAGNGPFVDALLPYTLVPDNVLCATGAVGPC